MRLPALALLTRSLRIESRSAWFALMRMGLLAIILISLSSAKSIVILGGAPGLHFFENTMMINLFFLTVAGFGFFASAISEEREEMSLGLLRMTALSPAAILLGKGTSRMLSALVLLAVQLPFTMLAVTLGGISPAQVLAAYITLGAYLVFLANLALLCSTLSARTLHASVATAILAILYFSFADRVVPGLSPGTRLSTILSTGYAGGLAGRAEAVNIGLGAALFLLSWLLFDLFTRNEKPAAPARGLVSRRTSRWRRFGTGRPRDKWNAVAWKDFHFIAGGKALVLTQIGVYLLLGGGLLAAHLTRYFGRVPFEMEVFATVYMVSSSLFLILACMSLSSRIFQQEVQWRTLACLWLLPLELRNIAWQKFVACLRGLWPSILLFVSCAALLFLRSVLKHGPDAGIGGIAFLGFVHGMFNLLLLLLLIVFISLVVKRGAILLSLLIYWAGQMVIGISGMLFFFLGPLGGMGIYIILEGAVCYLLVRKIGSKLRALVAAS